MRKLIPIICLLVFHATQSFCQIGEETLGRACDCLSNVLNSKTGKIEFQFAHQDCFKDIYSKTISLRSADSAHLFVESFFELLSAHCDSYNKCQEILDKYSLDKSQIRVKNKKACKQVMQVGEFEDPSGLERTIMSMQDSIQIMTFGESGIYTKSKVVWKDECTYNVIFVESTNPFESSLQKKGDERIVNIIDILNNEEVIYEVGMFGRWFVGRVKRIK